MHRIILTVMPSPPDVRCWWVCLFLLLTLDVRGATNSAWFNRVWQTDEGLPDNAVVGIAQTPDGFLRVATQGGLVRFDGNQFRGFVPITEVGALSGLLHGLTVDRRGRLWVVKDRGILACVENGRTTSHTLRRSSANARAVTPVEDADGTLWAAYPADGSRIVALRDGNISTMGHKTDCLQEPPSNWFVTNLGSCGLQRAVSWEFFEMAGLWCWDRSPACNALWRQRPVGSGSVQDRGY